MTAYIIRESKSMKLGLTTSFATIEEAEQAKQTLDQLNGFEQSIYTIESLENYGSASQRHFIYSKTFEARCDVIEEAVTKYLDEVAESEDEALIESVEYLAELVGYEFAEEKTFVLDVRVTAKVKRGYGDVTWSTFDLGLDTVTSDVEVLDFHIADVTE